MERGRRGPDKRYDLGGKGEEGWHVQTGQRRRRHDVGLLDCSAGLNEKRKRQAWQSAKTGLTTPAPPAGVRVPRLSHAQRRRHTKAAKQRLQTLLL